MPSPVRIIHVADPACTRSSAPPPQLHTRVPESLHSAQLEPVPARAVTVPPPLFPLHPPPQQKEHPRASAPSCTHQTAGDPLRATRVTPPPPPFPPQRNRMSAPYCHPRSSDR